MHLQNYLFAAVLFAFTAASASAATFNVTIEPAKDAASGTANYRLWLPDDLKTVRAIIVRQHGCGEGARQLGLEHADDLQWQALAKKHDCALLGSQLFAPEEDCSTWTIPQDGSEKSFLAALEKLAEVSQHAEIKTAPWCLWGHSGGAMWVCNMTFRHPARVVATFARSGGLAPKEREYKRSQPAGFESSPAALEVPLLFCFGETEADEKSRFFAGVEGARNLFTFGREHGAPWALAVHPKCDHENGNSRLLAIRYFDALLTSRLPNPQEETSTSELRPVDFKAGWFGVLKTHELRLAKAGEAKSLAEAWFPDEATAKAWREFSLLGTIRDTTPPPAPTNFKLTRSRDGNHFTWQADADVESGIGAFRIYRGGNLLGEVRGEVDQRWNPSGNYHAWNYSDQPLTGVKLPALKFSDRQADRASAAAYTLTMVNQAGLESEPVTAQEE